MGDCKLRKTNAYKEGYADGYEGHNKFWLRPEWKSDLSKHEGYLLGYAEGGTDRKRNLDSFDEYAVA